MNNTDLINIWNFEIPYGTSLSIKLVLKFLNNIVLYLIGGFYGVPFGLSVNNILFQESNTKI